MTNNGHAENHSHATSHTGHHGEAANDGQYGLPETISNIIAELDRVPNRIEHESSRVLQEIFNNGAKGILDPDNTGMFDYSNLKPKDENDEGHAKKRREKLAKDLVEETINQYIKLENSTGKGFNSGDLDDRHTVINKYLPGTSELSLRQEISAQIDAAYSEGRDFNYDLFQQYMRSKNRVRIRQLQEMPTTLINQYADDDEKLAELHNYIDEGHESILEHLTDEGKTDANVLFGFISKRKQNHHKPLKEHSIKDIVDALGGIDRARNYLKGSSVNAYEAEYGAPDDNEHQEAA